MAANGGFKPEGFFPPSFFQLGTGIAAQVTKNISKQIGSATDLQWGLQTQGCDGVPTLNTLEDVICCADTPDGPCPVGGNYVLLNRQRGVVTLVSSNLPRPMASVNGASPDFQTIPLAYPCDQVNRVSLLDSKGNKWRLDGTLRSTGETPFPARPHPDPLRWFQFDNDEFYRINYDAVWPNNNIFCGSQAQLRNFEGYPANDGFCGEYGAINLHQGALGGFSKGYPIWRGVCSETGCGFIQTDNLVFSVEVNGLAVSPSAYGVCVREAIAGGGAGQSRGNVLAWKQIPWPGSTGLNDMDIAVCAEGSAFVHITGDKRIYQYRYERPSNLTFGGLKLIRVVNLALDAGTAWDANTVLGAVLEAF